MEKKLKYVGFGVVLLAMGLCAVLSMEDLPPFDLLWFLLFAVPLLYLSIVLHELGHFLAFCLRGVEMALLYISPFLFQKKAGRWQFEIAVLPPILVGGLNVPAFFPIESDADFARQQKDIAVAVLAAPLVNIVLFLLFLAGCIFTTGHFYLFQAFCAGAVVNLLLLCFCLMSSGVTMGDLRVVPTIFEDTAFALSNLYQYAQWSPLVDADRQMDYLRARVETHFAQRDKNLPFDENELELLNYMLNDHLAGHLDRLPRATQEAMDDFWAGYRSYLHGEQTSEAALTLQHTLILQRARQAETKAEARERYREVICLVDHSVHADRTGAKNAPILTFLSRRSAFFVGLAQSDYLREEPKGNSLYALTNRLEKTATDSTTINHLQRLR